MSGVEKYFFYATFEESQCEICEIAIDFLVEGLEVPLKELLHTCNELEAPLNEMNPRVAVPEAPNKKSEGGS